MKTIAERAGVSRRTIYNYFPSHDDLLVTLACDPLEESIDAFFRRSGPVVGSRRAMSRLDDLLTAIDLPAKIAWTLTLLPEKQDLRAPRNRRLSERIVAEVRVRLERGAMRLSPDADRLDVALVVSAHVRGAEIMGRHWVSTNAADRDDAAHEWARMVAHLGTTIRTPHVERPGTDPPHRETHPSSEAGPPCEPSRDSEVLT